MKNFLMTESEKSRILGMHYNAMGKTLVNEQSEAGLGKHLPENLHVAYLNVVNEKDQYDLRISVPPYELTPARIKNKSYDVEFTVDNQNKTKTKLYYYQCIDAEPNQKYRNFKAGQIFDSSDRISDVASDLDSTGGPWREMFSWACKPAMAVLAARKAKEQPQAQVAAQTATAPDTTMADTQKRGAENTKKLLQTNEELRSMLADAQFLNPNKEKTELDNDVNQITSFLATKTPSGDDSMALKNKIRVLLKYKPEYKQAPYNLSLNMF